MADTPRGLQAHQPAAETNKAGTKTSASADERSSTRVITNHEIRRNIYDKTGKDVGSGIREKQANGESTESVEGASAESTLKAVQEMAKEAKIPTNCHSCGVDCTRIRYHFGRTMPSMIGDGAAKVKFDICPTCFQNQRYNGSPTDFIKLEDEAYNVVPELDAPWKDSEVLLLLESLEMWDDDWSAVASYVGTRTREECILKFLQLEIEDQYLEDDPNSGAPVSFGPLDYGKIPLTRADNPVLSVIAFLAGLSNPSVAAAAAGRSVDQLRKSIQHRLEKGLGGEESDDDDDDDDRNDAPTTKIPERERPKSEAADSMDVDTVAPATVTAPRPPEPELSKPPDEPPQTLPSLAFATSAARAAALASSEEREMTRLVSSAVNTMLEKLELKLKQFDEMEALVRAERRELDRARQALFVDRLEFRRRMADAGREVRLKKGGGGGDDEDDNDDDDDEQRDAGRFDFVRDDHMRKDAAAEPIPASEPGYRSLEI